MGCDMVVALKQVQGNTLFGLNHHDVCRPSQSLQRLPAADHAPDELLHLGNLVLPQVRRTCTVVGNQPCGTWGLTHGVNAHRVAAGFSRWQSRMPAAANGLLAADLIRLTLERSQSARQALDLLTDLIARHGLREAQTAGAGYQLDGCGDSIFLLADPREAFVVEAAGSFWAMLECQHVRAVSDIGLIRQDWRRISPGLAGHAVAQGWWADDGSKLDVVSCLGTAPPTSQPWPHQRWGKAMYLLEEQNGHIDPLCLRQMLGEHFESCEHTFRELTGGTGPALQLAASFIAALSSEPGVVPVVWCTYGPAGHPLYFPVLMEGDLPPLFAQRVDSLLGQYQECLHIAEHAQTVKKTIDRLQARFDHQLDEFLEETRASNKADAAQTARLAGSLMQSHWELLEAEARQLPSRSEKSLAVT